MCAVSLLQTLNSRNDLPPKFKIIKTRAFFCFRSQENEPRPIKRLEKEAMKYESKGGPLSDLVFWFSSKDIDVHGRSFGLDRLCLSLSLFSCVCCFSFSVRLLLLHGGGKEKRKRRNIFRILYTTEMKEQGGREGVELVILYTTRLHD